VQVKDDGAVNECALTVDAQGFVHWGKVRLPMRYERGALEFAIKDKRLWPEHGKRVRVPPDEFKQLERTPAHPPCRPAGRMPRESKQRIVPPRNKSVDKSG